MGEWTSGTVHHRRGQIEAVDPLPVTRPTKTKFNRTAKRTRTTFLSPLAALAGSTSALQIETVFLLNLCVTGLQLVLEEAADLINCMLSESANGSTSYFRLTAVRCTVLKLRGKPMHATLHTTLPWAGGPGATKPAGLTVPELGPR